MFNIVKIILLSVLLGVFYSGCIQSKYSNYFYYPKSKEHCLSLGMNPIYEDGDLICGGNTSHKNIIEKETAKINKKWDLEREVESNRLAEKEILKLNKLNQYEKDYLIEYTKIKQSTPKMNMKWVQPSNKKTSCKIYMGYYNEDPTKDDSFKVYWDGKCKNGYANGLGREFNKADLTDMWQIAIYRKGKPQQYAVMNDILNEYVLEGEYKYEQSNYQVRRNVNSSHGVKLIYSIGKFSDINEPALVTQTSPLWNNTVRYLKIYPNFRYEYIDTSKNDKTNLEYAFSIMNKHSIKNGWGFTKDKDHSLVEYEYKDEKSNQINLPSKFVDSAHDIIKEVKDVYTNAINAQSQAQLIKKQYIRKVCRKSIKVNFMDNEEYKEICNSKYETELSIKVQAKLDNISKVKSDKLEEERYYQQKQQEERFRQERLSIERQKLDQQRRQADATEDAAFQQSMNASANQQQVYQQIQQNYKVNRFIKYGY